jgi:endonuclease YncB( thermonuclease family)
MVPPKVNFNYPRIIRPSAQRQLDQVSDGDTPVIKQPIRMVSCDTPEKAGYAGNPEKSQPKLDRCRERLENGFYDTLPEKLREYLIKKLSDDAAEQHISAGNDATNEFNKLLKQRLTKPDGKKRGVATIPTGEIIDQYGRLLAYLAPWFADTKTDPLPPKDDPQRRTFNLDMIENGWAAFFPIYPSLPRNDDMNLAIAAAEAAWKKKLGIWKSYGRNVLLGYEFRACIKLAKAKNPDKGIENAFQRVCVDLRSLKIVGPYSFWKIDPCYRLWVWKKDLDDAVEALDLKEETPVN